ncbi:MAG TPA: hypothetical protein VF855_14405 [Acidimicrobiales bacterium]
MTATLDRPPAPFPPPRTSTDATTLATVVASTRRMRRDAVLAVRTGAREAVSLVLTLLVALSIPLAAVGVLQVDRRMEQAELAAATLEDVAPTAATVADVTAEVARRLADIAKVAGPSIRTTTAQVEEVASSIESAADRLGPLLKRLDTLTSAVRRIGGDALADAVEAIRDAVLEVVATVGRVAGTTIDIARQVEQLTEPETIATLEQSAGVINGIGDLSRSAGDMAKGYIERAATYKVFAQVAAVLSLLVTVAVFVRRSRQHRRWLELRRRGAGTSILGALQPIA